MRAPLSHESERAPAGAPPAAGVHPAERIIEIAQAHPMTDHAYFRRLRSEPPSPSAMWAYFANLSTITCHAPRWLGKLLGKTEDPRFQCLVAQILYDELGSGNPEQNHARLLQKAIDGLDPWRPAAVGIDPIGPGRKLFDWMEEFFDKEPFDVLHLIGALILGEVVAQQMVAALAVETRRQHGIDDSVFEWVLVHDEVEHSHVEVSETLVGLVPSSGPGLEQVMNGARWKYENTWEWLDGMYRIAYGEVAETSRPATPTFLAPASTGALL